MNPMRRALAEALSYGASQLDLKDLRGDAGDLWGGLDWFAARVPLQFGKAEQPQKNCPAPGPWRAVR
jgi:hypothetical protein